MSKTTKQLWFDAYCADQGVSMETRGDIAYRRGFEAGRKYVAPDPAAPFGCKTFHRPGHDSGKCLACRGRDRVWNGREWVSPDKQRDGLTRDIYVGILSERSHTMAQTKAFTRLQREILTVLYNAKKGLSAENIVERVPLRTTIGTVKSELRKLSRYSCVYQTEPGHYANDATGDLIAANMNAAVREAQLSNKPRR